MISPKEKVFNKDSGLPISVVVILSGLCVSLWVKSFVAFFKVSDWKLYDVVSLGSGILFLGDIWCVIWWFDRYVYLVSPPKSLGLQFLDSWIAGTFVLATEEWKNPDAFLIATILALPALIFRFYRIHNSQEATEADKRLLWKAMFVLVVTFLLAVSAYTASSFLQRFEKELLLLATPGYFSLVGIILTFLLRHEVSKVLEQRKQKKNP